MWAKNFSSQKARKSIRSHTTDKDAKNICDKSTIVKYSNGPLNKSSKEDLHKKLQYDTLTITYIEDLPIVKLWLQASCNNSCSLLLNSPRIIQRD